MPKEETLNVKIDTQLLEQFREKAQKKYGYKRGYLKKATIDSINLFLNE